LEAWFPVVRILIETRFPRQLLFITIILYKQNTLFLPRNQYPICDVVHISFPLTQKKGHGCVVAVTVAVMLDVAVMVGKAVNVAVALGKRVAVGVMVGVTSRVWVGVKLG
jgi:hypothetical protein